MSQSLKAILKEMSEVKTAASKNISEFAKITTASEQLKESMEMDEEDTVDDTDMGESPEGVDDQSYDDAMASGEEEEDTMVSDVDDVDMEPEDVEGTEDMEKDPYTDYYDEDGNVDLVNIDDEDLIYDLISKAPEGTTFVKVSRPALEVTTPEVTDDNYDDDEMAEVPEIEPEPVMEEKVVDKKSGTEVDKTIVEHATKLAQKNKVIKIYEDKLQKLQVALKKSRGENAILKEEQVEVMKVIKEAKTTLTDLHLINENLKNAAKLMVEHGVSPKQRKEILKDFNDKGNSINESKLIYEMWDKSLRSSKLEEATMKNVILGKKPVISETVNKLTDNKISDNRIDEKFARLSGQIIK